MARKGTQFIKRSSGFVYHGFYFILPFGQPLIISFHEDKVLESLKIL